MKPLRKFRFAAAAALALGLAATPAIFAQDSDSAEETQAPTFSMPDDAVLFSTNTNKWTVEEFENIIRYRAPQALFRVGAGITNLEDFSPGQVEEAAEDFAWRMEALRRFDEEGVEVNRNILANLEQEKDAIGFRIWLEENNVLDVGEAPDELLMERYEEEKERYRVFEELRFKHIFLSTYERYEVKEGDSLESIAEEIAGDADMADRIMTNENPPEVRAEVMETKDGEEVAPRPLQPGEILRVPMSDKKVAEVRERAEKVMKEIEDGMEFDKAAEEYSETSADNKGRMLVVRPEKDEKEILDDLKQAFLEAEDGELAGPVRTKHGFQIIERARYRAPGYRDFEDVKSGLAARWTGEQRQERFRNALEETCKRARNQGDVIEIEKDILMNAEKPENENEVIMQIGDVKYIGENFVRDFGQKLDDVETYDDRLDLLIDLPLLQRKLVAWDSEILNLEEKPIFQKRWDWARASYLADSYLNHVLEGFTYEPTEEELAATFEQNKASFQRQPGAEVWQMTFSPENPQSPTLSEDLQALRGTVTNYLTDIDSPEAFAAAAKRYSQDTYAEEGGKRGVIYGHHEEGVGQQIVKNAAANSLYGPVVANNKVYAFWVGEKFNTTEPTIEKFENVVKRMIERQKKTEEREKLRRGIIEASDFVYRGK